MILAAMRPAQFAPILLLSLASCASMPDGGSRQARIDARFDEAAAMERSIAVAQSFQDKLQAQLAAALQAGGPVQAIGVCKQAAPKIAAEESAASGAQVSRVAERNRNPAGGLTEEMRPYYAKLAEAPLVDGFPATAMWRSGVGKAERINVLRAIPMQDKPCSTCHGTNISPDLAELLHALYPADRATGFAPGEMRGAMLVSWPASVFEVK